MKKISQTGLGLTVRINCPEISRIYDWMTFATWYTCCRSLPEAKFCISIPKVNSCKEILFTWLDRCKIKKIPENLPVNEPTLMLNTQSIQLREFYPEEMEEINSGIRLIGNNCELYQKSNSVKKVDWLSSTNVVKNPVFLYTTEMIGEVNIRSWAAQSKEPIFVANWTPKTLEEKFVLQAWQRINMYYAMATRLHIGQWSPTTPN